MKRLSALASLGACFSFSTAAPARTSRAPSAIQPIPIAPHCTNAHITQNWIVADCPTGPDSDDTIESAVYLPNKITNDDGVLKWKADGNYMQTCSDCKLANGGASLNCQCRPNYGQRKDTTIDLNEHISVYAGHLLSNLNGAPSVPSQPSTFPVPSDLSFGFGGNATCPDNSSTTPGFDWCKQVAHTCTTSNARTDTSDVSFRMYGPLGCYVPVVYMPYHFQFEVIKLVGEGAWEMVGYADEQCTTPVGTISSEDMGVCTSFQPRVRAISVRPAFNGDPN